MTKKLTEVFKAETFTEKDRKEWEEMSDLFAGACSILEERDELTKYARTLEKKIAEGEKRINETVNRAEEAEAEAEFWHGEYNELAAEMRELREEYKSAVDLTSDYWEECKKSKALADSALSLVEFLLSPEQVADRFELDPEEVRKFADKLGKD